MRENKHRRIAILTPTTHDIETQQELIAVRNVTANPIIKVEDGEKKFSYLVSMETQEDRNNVFDLAHYFHSSDVIISIEDRSSFIAERNNFSKVKKNLGYLRGVQEDTAKEENLYLYDPQTEDYYIFQ